MGAVGVGAALQRRRDGHRGARRADRRRARARRRPRQPRPAWAQGPVRLAGERLARSLDAAAGPRAAAGWSRATGTRRWAGIVERSKELLAGPGGWGRFGFYTSGQLFLEEYYTLAVIGKAGIGTPHMDGNTRLCTATAAAALKASFGTDGQPGSYTDVDHCDAIALWGHNVAETQTVLWIADARPPARHATRRGCSCVDPRDDAGGARGRRPPRAARRDEPGADERGCSAS